MNENSLGKEVAVISIMMEIDMMGNGETTKGTGTER
jgi:hypothetical protein